MTVSTSFHVIGMLCLKNLYLFTCIYHFIKCCLQCVVDITQSINFFISPHWIQNTILLKYCQKFLHLKCFVDEYDFYSTSLCFLSSHRRKITTTCSWIKNSNLKPWKTLYIIVPIRNYHLILMSISQNYLMFYMTSHITSFYVL